MNRRMLAIALVAAGCTGPDQVPFPPSSLPPPSPPSPQVVIVPDRAVIDISGSAEGAPIQVRAVVGGDSTVPVEWSVSDTAFASISSAGLLRGSPCLFTGAIKVRAVVSGDSSLRAAALVSIIDDLPAPARVTRVLVPGTETPVAADHLVGSVDVEVSILGGRPCPIPGMAFDSVVLNAARQSAVYRLGAVSGLTVIPPPIQPRFRWNTDQRTVDGSRTLPKWRLRLDRHGLSGWSPRDPRQRGSIHLQNP